MFDNGADRLLDVARLATHQFARTADFMAPESPTQATRVLVVDAANRFVARGGYWQPDDLLLRRIDAAALGISRVDESGYSVDWHQRSGA